MSMPSRLTNLVDSMFAVTVNVPGKGSILSGRDRSRLFFGVNISHYGRWDNRD